MKKQRFSLEKRKELAENRELSVKTESGEWVQVEDTFTCPELCGNIFASEEAFRAYCPSDCMVKTKEQEMIMRSAENTPVYTVYILYDSNGVALKAIDTLEGPRSRWWWRNVSAIALRHFVSQEAAEGAIKTLQEQLHPTYDIDPHALGEPRPLSQRVAEEKDGPNEIHVAFRASDSLDSRITEAAEREGLSRAEWLRRACALYAG